MRFWFTQHNRSGTFGDSAHVANVDSVGARSCDPACTTPCTGPCALSSLPAGVRAVIVTIGCPFSEASRLRALGVFEGARIGIVERCGGFQLDVHGSRLALDASVAAAILVDPLPA